MTHWGHVEYCIQCKQPYCIRCSNFQNMHFCSEECLKAYEKEKSEK